MHGKGFFLYGAFHVWRTRQREESPYEVYLLVAATQKGIASIWMERTEVIQGPPFIQCSLFSSFSNGNCCKTLDLS
ncbi:uncharacterized protein LOC100240848 isoform X5 [Vitis vinifera]|uniref:uncharacterized protein LOC100240848 isoform X5 n=1 Tax=Vitis vinifera TaxID=29760 RepID=UPI002882DD7A|nr:uncharacterized protein LOC100240848 isoform X5 [Vitis vinifera]